MAADARHDTTAGSPTRIRRICLAGLAMVPLLFACARFLNYNAGIALYIMEWIICIASLAVYIRHRMGKGERSLVVELVGFLVLLFLLLPLLLLIIIWWAWGSGGGQTWI